MAKFTVTPISGGMKKGENVIRISPIEFTEDMATYKNGELEGFVDMYKPRVYTERLNLKSNTGNTMAFVNLNQLFPEYNKVSSAVTGGTSSSSDLGFTRTGNNINIIVYNNNIDFTLSVNVLTNQARITLVGNLATSCSEVSVGMVDYPGFSRESAVDYVITKDGKLNDYSAGNQNLIPYIISQTFNKLVDNGRYGWLSPIEMRYFIKFKKGTFNSDRPQTFTIGAANVTITNGNTAMSIASINKSGSVYVNGNVDVNFTIEGGPDNAVGTYDSKAQTPTEADAQVCPGYESSLGEDPLG